MKIMAIVLGLMLLILIPLSVIRATEFTIYEDGSWGFTVFQVQVTGCWPVMGCLVLDEVLPVDEEWMDSNEYIVGGPLLQDGMIVISGLNHSSNDATFWNCFHSLRLCFLRHDDRPLFYRIMPEFPPPGWSLIFGEQEC
jgi:hypothetical protein